MMVARACRTIIDERNRFSCTSAPHADHAVCRDDEVSPTAVIPFQDGTPRHRLEGRHAGFSQSAELRLITDLAARLVTVEPGAIDDAIADELGQIAQLFQLDRAIILWRKAAEDETSGVSSYDWLEYPQPPRSELPQLVSISFIASKLEAGQATWFASIEEVPAPEDREAFRRQGVRSAAAVPMATGGASGTWGGLVVGSATVERDWPPVIAQLRLVSAIFGQALARKANLNALQRARAELHHLREHVPEPDVQRDASGSVFLASRPRDYLQVENECVRHQGRERFSSGMVVGESAAIHRVLEQVRQVAATNSTVLLLGETGTGKELLATRIHEQSARQGRAMVRVNCAAIPSTLIESELFGREKGAFTGALARQIGRFELADRSTIFLDEIGDLSPEVQVKLLRVLEERLVERLGNPKPIRVDVRVIAATHRNLDKKIAEGAFREDLFYRLNVFPIEVPSLRDRAEDIPFLVWDFVREFSISFGKRIEAISRKNMTTLQQYTWPGNIRELRNAVERAMIVATGPQLTIAVPTSSCPPGSPSLRLADVEKEHVRRVLESTGWRIRGVNGAAGRLGLRPTTLETRMAKLGLSRPKPA